MKRRYRFFYLLIAILGTGLTACQEDYVLDPAPSKLDGIDGTFTVSKVMQLDPNTFGELNSLDITDAFVGDTPAEITFDSESGSFTYQTGTTIDFIGAAGSWAFDNNDYPTKITMVESGTSYDLALVNSIRPQDELVFQLDRICGGAVSSSYQYMFTRN